MIAVLGRLLALVGVLCLLALNGCTCDVATVEGGTVTLRTWAIIWITGAVFWWGVCRAIGGRR